MANRFTPIQPGTESNQQISIINKNFAELDKESVTKLYYNNDGNVGLITGLLPDDLGIGTLIKDSDGNNSIAMYVTNDGTPVMKVAKSGEDALTGTDSDLIFNSAQNVFKIAQTGTATITVPGTMLSLQVASTTVTHNLGFKPAIIAYITGGTAWGTSAGQMLMMPFSSEYIVAGTFRGFFYTDAYTTDTTAVFRHTNKTTVTDTTGGTVDIKYYLLQETAN